MLTRWEFTDDATGKSVVSEGAYESGIQAVEAEEALSSEMPAGGFSYKPYAGDRLKISSEDVARVCHEANRTYCHVTGTPAPPPWRELSELEKEGRGTAVEQVLAKLRSGVKPSPEDQHNAWMTSKLKDGWRYGPARDDGLKVHPCLLPYSELPAEQRMKDVLFLSICGIFK